MTDLYYTATPTTYAPSGAAGKGFFLAVEKGACILDFDIRGISAPYCTYASGVGRIDESASLEGTTALVAENVDMTAVVGGELGTINLPLRDGGMTPLRAFYLSQPIGRDIPGGKTLYSIEVITDCQDTIFVNVLRKASSREPFRAKTWAKILPYKTMVTIPTSGLEFMVMLYVKGGGAFRIHRVTAWCKLTDRRGLHTFGGGQRDNAGDTDQGA